MSSSDIGVNAASDNIPISSPPLLNTGSLEQVKLLVPTTNINTTSKPNNEILETKNGDDSGSNNVLDGNILDEAASPGETRDGDGNLVEQTASPRETRDGGGGGSNSFDDNPLDETAGPGGTGDGDSSGSDSFLDGAASPGGVNPMNDKTSTCTNTTPPIDNETTNNTPTYYSPVRADPDLILRTSEALDLELFKTSPHPGWKNIKTLNSSTWKCKFLVQEEENETSKKDLELIVNKSSSPDTGASKVPRNTNNKAKVYPTEKGNNSPPLPKIQSKTKSTPTMNASTVHPSDSSQFANKSSPLDSSVSKVEHGINNNNNNKVKVSPIDSSQSAATGSNDITDSSAIIFSPPSKKRGRAMTAFNKLIPSKTNESEAKDNDEGGEVINSTGARSSFRTTLNFIRGEVSSLIHVDQKSLSISLLDFNSGKFLKKYFTEIASKEGGRKVKLPTHSVIQTDDPGCIIVQSFRYSSANDTVFRIVPTFYEKSFN